MEQSGNIPVGISKNKRLEMMTTSISALQGQIHLDPSVFLDTCIP